MNDDGVILRTDADWDAMASALGRAQGDCITWQRVVREACAEAVSLRAQVTALSEQLYKPPGPATEGGV